MGYNKFISYLNYAHFEHNYKWFFILNKSKNWVLVLKVMGS